MQSATCQGDASAKRCSFCSVLEPLGGGRLCTKIAGSAVMRELTLRAAQIARTDSTVVILGETGSGKEVLARAIHANSARRKAPFLAVNVAALPAELLESE